MKHLLLISLIFLSIVGCKTNSATTLDNKTENAMKGNWIISSVNYPGSDVIKVNSFQIADAQCMVGSTWKLVANNNKGEMVVEKQGCPYFASDISWFVNKDGNVVLKILEGEKGKRVNEGYILRLANLNADVSFQLIDKINVGGKMTDVVYQFNKN